MGQPNDFSTRKRLAQTGDSRKGVDDISERAKAHDQEARLRHAAPCEQIRGILAWSDPWGRLRWPRGCLAAWRLHILALSRRCSQCLSRGRPAAVLREELRRWVLRRVRRNPRSEARQRVAHGRSHRGWGGPAL